MQNSLNNSGLPALARQAAPHVLDAIKRASAATGVSFAYMMQKASAESSFDTRAKSRTSSATGLYQFIESTWLNMVRKYGDKCGLSRYAACIDDNGHVADPAMKKEILALRKNPEASAMMAAEFTAENKAYLRDQLGPDAKIGPTELYLAHFFGAGGAAGFMKEMKENPLQQASDLFPKAASANRAVFYDSKTGAPRTLAGIYEFFAGKFGNAADVAPKAAPAPGTRVMVADAPDSEHASRRALAQSLVAQIDGEKTVLGAGGRTGARMASRAQPETIHWFTPRRLKLPGGAPQIQPSIPRSLISDPVHLMMLARADMPQQRSRLIRGNFGYINS